MHKDERYLSKVHANGQIGTFSLYSSSILNQLMPITGGLLSSLFLMKSSHAYILLVLGLVSNFLVLNLMNSTDIRTSEVPLCLPEPKYFLSFTFTLHIAYLQEKTCGILIFGFHLLFSWIPVGRNNYKTDGCNIMLIWYLVCNYIYTVFLFCFQVVPVCVFLVFEAFWPIIFSEKARPHPHRGEALPVPPLL